MRALLLVALVLVAAPAAAQLAAFDRLERRLEQLAGPAADEDDEDAHAPTERALPSWQTDPRHGARRDAYGPGLHMDATGAPYRALRR
jgi:hypothetical protein